MGWVWLGHFQSPSMDRDGGLKNEGVHTGKLKAFSTKWESTQEALSRASNGLFAKPHKLRSFSALSVTSSTTAPKWEMPKQHHRQQPWVTNALEKGAQPLPLVAPASSLGCSGLYQAQLHF